MVLRTLRTRNRQLEAERTIERMAFQDPLTGLPNRAAMRERIAKAVATARERQRALAILSVHVGHFDEISDTLGHAAGDRLMAEVAGRVAAVARSGQDALARIGEDELVVLLRDADAAHASDVARRVVDALYRPVELAGLQVDARGAVGIALHPDHGDDADELMRRAKVAMYRAGANGHFALYSGMHDDERRHRLALIDDLRRAIDADELLLFCQPKVDMRDAPVLRRRSADALEASAPGDDLAGDLRRVGREQRPDHAADAMGARSGVSTRGIAGTKPEFEQPLAVNLSARDLHDPRLVDRVRGLMSAWGIREGWMQFELDRIGADESNLRR